MTYDMIWLISLRSNRTNHDQIFLEPTRNQAETLVCSQKIGIAKNRLTLANVSSVLDDSYLPPTFSASPDKVALNERMQNIVKALIMTATMGTLAAPFLDHKQDGRTMFLW